MTRLPRRGVTLASVPRGREVLEEILHNLKVEHAIELNLTDTDCPPSAPVGQNGVIE